MRTPSDTSDAMKRNFEKRSTVFLKAQIIKSPRSGVPLFEDSTWSKQSSIVPKRILGSKSSRTRMVGGLPKPLNVATANLPLISWGAPMNKLQGHATSLFENKARSNTVTKTLVQEQRVASEFLTIRCDKGRMVRSKTTPLQAGTRILCGTGGVNRISHVQMLQLFQALVKEPLSFLELRGRFGVSKQTIKRLVKNGLLTEAWGPKAVGVRFAPSDKGEVYLKELEAAAKYEPNAGKNVIIRLKQATAL